MHSGERYVWVRRWSLLSQGQRPTRFQPKSSGIHVFWKKPSDIHVALGDFKLMDREHNRPVDPKLLLLDSASKSSRTIREFIKPVCRDRVIQIAGGDRKKLCRAKSGVKLC